MSDVRPALLAHQLDFSGASIALLYLARSLIRLGHSPIVATTRDGPLRPLFEREGVPIVESLRTKEMAFLVANTAVAIQSGLKAKLHGVPVAAWIHEACDTLPHLNVDLATSGIERFDLVMHPALFQQEEMGAILPNLPLAQLRNHVIQPHFRLPGATPAFAVVGNFEARKGQKQLLNLIEGSGSRCSLLFIGAESPPGETPPPGVEWRFMGKIPPDESKTVIANCDGLISCSTAEVQPLAVIEALLAGRPVLLSDIKAHREIAGQFTNAFLFDRGSAASFAQGLASLTAAKDDLAGAAANRVRGLRIFGEKAFDARVNKIVDYLSQRR